MKSASHTAFKGCEPCQNIQQFVDLTNCFSYIRE